MRTIVVGQCSDGRLLKLADPDAPSEAEFQQAVIKGLSCVYASYDCVLFEGTFTYDGRGFQSDLALVAKNRSHWFVIEVELVTHSFDNHVLPQVKALRYGTPQSDCAAILADRLSIGIGRAMTLVEFLPRSVAVVANRRDLRWEIALAAHNVQLVTAAMFAQDGDSAAIEIEGNLDVVEMHVGFGEYSATDRSIRFSRRVSIPDGELQINDPTGTLSTWTAIRTDGAMWLTKNRGVPDFEHGAHVQVVRTIGGRLSFRRTPERVRY